MAHGAKGKTEGSGRLDSEGQKRLKGEPSAVGGEMAWGKEQREDWRMKTKKSWRLKAQS
jgi:hypothetical protein